MSPWPTVPPHPLTPEQQSARGRHAAKARTRTEHLIALLGRRSLTADQLRSLADLLITASPSAESDADGSASTEGKA